MPSLNGSDDRNSVLSNDYYKLKQVINLA